MSEATVALRSLGTLYRAVPAQLKSRAVEEAALEIARFVAQGLPATEVRAELDWLAGAPAEKLPRRFFACSFCGSDHDLTRDVDALRVNRDATAPWHVVLMRAHQYEHRHAKEVVRQLGLGERKI
ncbi:MAG TPA: hypothetical protein VHW03_10080 [Chthoniobacterales bacterium]|jgi:hypothetical protein|nr:hypothetical protein [Chthoniobacterales bacterium]